MPGTAVALLPVRSATLPPGGDECAAEAGGAALLVGEGTATAAAELAGVCSRIEIVETGRYAPRAWAVAIAPAVRAAELVVLPASPDGRDLAPLLAAELDRPLLANAVEVEPGRAAVTRFGGLVLEELRVDGPFVATLQPGVRAVERRLHQAPVITEIGLAMPAAMDADMLAELPPDAATMDLADATRIVGAGAGLLDGTAEEIRDRIEALRAAGLAMGASLGATRVVTDAGWLPHERQIGTTGVVVHPRLYLAFGVSGAVQHTAGLGHPDHVISVNTDAHCPMMTMADLAVVADARATVAELARLLAAEAGGDRGTAA